MTAVLIRDTRGAATPPAPDPAVLPYWGAPSLVEDFAAADPRTPSGLNPDLWNVRDGAGTDYEQGWQTGRPENVRVEDGALKIRVIQETGAVALNGATQPANRPYTTGYIDTRGKHDRRYGRWEIDAKMNLLAPSRGIWSAAWFRPTNPPAGVDGEIDLNEGYGAPSSRSDYREGSSTWTLWKDETSGTKVSGWLTPAGYANLSLAYHKYVLEWTPDVMRLKVDDYVATERTPANLAWFDSSFAAPFHLRLQIQVAWAQDHNYWGYADPARPDLTKSPSDDFCIRSVRYWDYPG